MKNDPVPAENPEPSPWRRRVRRGLITGIAAIAVLGLGILIESYRARQDWENYQQILKARGEKFELEAYRTPEIPDAENFAAIPVYRNLTNQAFRGAGGSASALFPWSWPRGDWNSKQFTDWAGWQEEIRRGSTQLARYGVPEKAPPEEIMQVRQRPMSAPQADLFSLLETREAVLRQVREAVSRPYTRFDIEVVLEDPDLAVLSRTRELARAFQTKALAELSLENAAAALEDWKVVMRLAEAIGSEPLLVFHLMQITILNAALQPVWEGLARQQWTEDQLREIEQTLGGVNLSPALARSYRGERILNMAGLETMPHRPNQESAMPIPKSWLPQVLVTRNQLNIARMYQEYFLTALDPQRRDFDLGQLKALEADREERFDRKTPYNFIAAMLYETVLTVFHKSLRMQANIELARTACALELWRRERGEYPHDLKQLVPKILKTIPSDPCDQSPLRYRVEENGEFVLYSIGNDYEDDDGNSWNELDQRQQRNTDAGDLVWKSRKVPSQARGKD